MELLDIKILPYVIFLVVPVLGRMSDPDDDIRFLATRTFATLVKLVPLEVRCVRSFKSRFFDCRSNRNLRSPACPILQASRPSFWPNATSSASS